MPADVVILREVLEGRVRSVRPLRVVDRNGGGLAGYLVPDSEVAWPRLTDGTQSQTPDQGWELSLERWFGPGSLYLLSPDLAWATVLFLDRASLEPQGWKIDFLEPPVPTALGFDTLDWSLDLLVSVDRSTIEVKDRDDLAQILRLGRLGVDGARRVEHGERLARAALVAPAGLLGRTWEAWASWRPEPDWEPLTLPEGWDEVPADPAGGTGQRLATRHGAALRALGPRPNSSAGTSGSGHYHLDANGRRTLDLDLGAGTLLHGHAHPLIVEAIVRQNSLGLAAESGHEGEVRLAELLVARFKPNGCVSWAMSGHAALDLAVAGARHATGRTTVATLGSAPPSSDVIALSNDLDRAKAQLTIAAGRLAAVVVEPLALVERTNWRQLVDLIATVATERGVPIIADERLTLGVAVDGATRLLELDADLVVLGDAVFGGLSGGAVVGADRFVALPGPFVPHPITTAAALATLELTTPDRLARIVRLADRLRAAWNVGGLGNVVRLPRAPALQAWSDVGVRVSWQGLLWLSTVADDEMVEQILGARAGALRS